MERPNFEAREHHLIAYYLSPVSSDATRAIMLQVTKLVVVLGLFALGVLYNETVWCLIAFGMLVWDKLMSFGDYRAMGTFSNIIRKYEQAFTEIEGQKNTPAVSQGDKG